MSLRRGTLCICILLVASVVSAEQPEMPQPTAEHKALELWVGTWSGEGDLKPGIFGPGGPMSWNEECAWFEGSKFHVVCTSEGASPMGPVKGLGIVGYNSEREVYTHYGVDNNGWSAYSEGTREGDTWTYFSKETMGGRTYHTRATMTLTAPDTMKFTWEMSEDGENWVLLMEGTSTKK
ncbi:MAG: DUF1579 domain-containing protein [Acidobacteria bacterium]|jgi:hypothetical protein|nr:DUF1579 domain-containing protein [Acidobacteriota bacterium]